jgi:hypothetical protein
VLRERSQYLLGVHSGFDRLKGLLPSVVQKIYFRVPHELSLTTTDENDGVECTASEIVFTRVPHGGRPPRSMKIDRAAPDLSEGERLFSRKRERLFSRKSPMVEDHPEA